MSLAPGVLLMSLRSRGVVIVLDAGEIVYRAPRGVLSAGDLAVLKQHKPVLLSILAGQCRSCGSTLYLDESEAVGRCTSCRMRRATDG